MKAEANAHSIGMSGQLSQFMNVGVCSVQYKIYAFILYEKLTAICALVTGFSSLFC